MIYHYYYLYLFMITIICTNCNYIQRTKKIFRFNNNNNDILYKKKEKYNIYEKIQKIYVIHLKTRTDRKLQISLLLSKYFPNKEVQYFNAITKKDIYKKQNRIFWEGRLDLKLRKEKNNSFEIASPFEGTIACYVSHFKVLINLYLMNTTKKNNKKKEDGTIFLVLEDDCIFEKKTIQLLKSDTFASSIPKPWSILKPIWGKKNDQDKINNIFYNVTKARNRSWDYYFGNHFMLYNSEMSHHILWKMIKKNVNDIDVILSKNVDFIYAFDYGNIKQNVKSISDRDPNKKKIVKKSNN